MRSPSPQQIKPKRFAAWSFQRNCTKTGSTMRRICCLLSVHSSTLGCWVWLAFSGYLWLVSFLIVTFGSSMNLPFLFTCNSKIPFFAACSSCVRILCGRTLVPLGFGMGRGTQRASRIESKLLDASSKLKHDKAGFTSWNTIFSWRSYACICIDMSPRKKMSMNRNIFF